MAKSSVMANSPFVAPTFTVDQEAAAIEVRRQLSRAYALIAGAKARLNAMPDKDSATIELLEMAEDVVGDLDYINRLAPEANAPLEVANG
jgi:hypothetical protein